MLKRHAERDCVMNSLARAKIHQCRGAVGGSTFGVIVFTGWRDAARICHAFCVKCE